MYIVQTVTDCALNIVKKYSVRRKLLICHDPIIELAGLLWAQWTTLTQLEVLQLGIFTVMQLYRSLIGLVHIFDIMQPMFVFVNGMSPGKSLKTSLLSPRKPWNLVFAIPGKSWKMGFECLYEPWSSQRNIAVHFTCIFQCSLLVFTGAESCNCLGKCAEIWHFCCPEKFAARGCCCQLLWCRNYCLLCCRFCRCWYLHQMYLKQLSILHVLQSVV